MTMAMPLKQGLKATDSDLLQLLSGTQYTDQKKKTS